MDLRLELRRTSKLVVASPKGDSVSVPGTPVPGSGFFRPFRDWFAEKSWGQVGVASPERNSVSVGFLSRHSRAGLWVLPSLPGLVCGKELWPGWLWRPLKGTRFPLVCFPGTPVPGSGFFRPFRDWFAERICGQVGCGVPLKGTWFPLGLLSRHSRAGLWVLPSLPQLVCGKDLWPDWLWRPLKGTGFHWFAFPALPCRALGSSVPSATGLRKRFVARLVVASPKGDSVPLVCFPGTPVPGSGFFRPYRD
jgi:hypothetical protein